jgi:hypothetical protein
MDNSAQILPLPTPEIIERLEVVDSYSIETRMQGLQELKNNFYGVELKPFGNILAARSAGLPYPFFNRVVGLSDGQQDQLEELLAWYSAAKLPCRLELDPTTCGPELLTLLARRGFYQSGFIDLLYGLPLPKLEEFPSGVQVRRLESEERPLFSKIYHLGSEYKGTRLAEVREMVEAEHSHPDWKLYLATVDGEPAAVAALIARAGVGYLGTAATVPALRGKGCQSALLQRRLADASQNCDLVTSLALPGSVSERNLRRAGLTVAFTKVFWTALDSLA